MDTIVIRLSDRKFNREFPTIIRILESKLCKILMEHDKRGVKDSSFCISALLREALAVLTHLSDLRLSNDLESIKLCNGIVGRSNANTLVERQEKAISAILTGHIIPILEKVLRSIHGNHNEAIDTLYTEAAGIKVKARHTIETIILEEDIKNRGVVLTPINISDLHFVQSPAIRQCIEKDIRELYNSISSRDCKTIIIICGSIAEALLLDAVLQRETDALRADNKGKGDIRRWNLEVLIDVAGELSIISDTVVKQCHLLRENRNIVHPGKMIKSSISAKPEDADISINILRNIILSQGGKF